MTVPDRIGPGLRLIEARSRLHRADLAVMSGEAQAHASESWVASDAARAAYAELTDAARELVAAQEAFDAHCKAKRTAQFNPAPAPVPDACPESKMDDGSHALDYEDTGHCPWCGAVREDGDHD